MLGVGTVEMHRKALAIPDCAIQGLLLQLFLNLLWIPFNNKLACLSLSVAPPKVGSNSLVWNIRQGWEATDNNKHFSLLQYGSNYCFIKFYSTSLCMTQSGIVSAWWCTLTVPIPNNDFLILESFGIVLSVSDINTNYLRNYKRKKIWCQNIESTYTFYSFWPCNKLGCFVEDKTVLKYWFKNNFYNL